MSINEYLKYGELAEVAYIDLETGELNSEDIEDDGDGLSSTQARTFAETYTVIDQYNQMAEVTFIDELGFEQTYFKSTGLSVTLFEDGGGNQTVAIRGTNDLYDAWTDFIDIAILGSAETQEQYSGLSAKVQEWMDDNKLNSGFSVTGHSLGGFLATNLALKYSADIAHAYIYNAPGVVGVNGNILEAIVNALSPDDPISIPAVLQISNIIAADDIVSSVGLPISTPVVLTVEEKSFWGSHSISGLTDALAVYNLFGTIDSNLSVDTITDILNAFPVADNDNLLEAVISTVGKIYGEDYPATETSSDEESSRDIFHANLSDLMSGISQATITSLTQSSTTVLETLTGSKGQLYALLNLNPFYIEGVDYSFLNVDGYLEAENYSEKFIQDRAAFLYHSINEGELSPTSEDIDFKDLSLDVQAYAGNGEIDLPVNAKYIFGSERADSISGGSSIVNRADHLYGMGGNDTIQGYGGADYIEGGVGRDTMKGGSGNDTFFIKGTDSDYDIFNGGLGVEDKIQGSTGDDTIRFHDFQGENTVEIINGGGGEDTIAGTDMADTIDLSGTTLIGIKEIRGGDMTDIIIFSRDDYNLTWRFAA